MRIACLSNIILSDESPKSSGTWISSMLNKLSEKKGIELCNISLGKEKILKRKDYRNIIQWIIPDVNKKKDLPSQDTIDSIINIIEIFKPDIIHIWGVEYYWGLLTSRHYLPKSITLLEMQGLKGECSNHFFTGLNLGEILSTLRLLELRYPKLFILYQKNEFKKWGLKETEIIKGHQYINTQSKWIKNIIYKTNPNANVFDTGIILRDEFMTAKPWKLPIQNNIKYIFTVTSAAPYKGLHITIKAFSILKKKYPNLILRIAGVQIKKDYWKNSGYVQYLRSLSIKLNVYDSIDWLGNLSAEEILKEYYQANVFIISSFIESYCLALAEALLVGLPTVIAETSALPELAVNNIHALFYPPENHAICAKKIENILIDNELALKLSRNARKSILTKSNTNEIVDNQIETYKFIINNSKLNENQK